MKVVHSIAVCLLLFCAAAEAAPKPSVLATGDMRLPRDTEPLPQEIIEYLRNRNPERARVWVFFTDKNLDTRGGFATAASSVVISERALNRRAKMGLDQVLFADLAVSPEYVSAVLAAGAQKRKISRWLNAVSVDVSLDQLEEIGRLPFVRRILPVSVATRKPLPEVPYKSGEGPATASPGALNYGGSLSQLNQINVPQLHGRGLDGTGVTLAIFDTGFRKTHDAFAPAVAGGRLLAEYDFVFEDGNTSNEPEDAASAWSHGTYIWSVSAGQKDGQIYGPAYMANIILCKTEDVRSETHAEEDNWVAALEWVDSLGADVVTSSLGYLDFDAPETSYTYADLDGATAICTQAASTAAGLGIVVCNSMGNSGPSAGTLTAPADAFDIVAVGAVNSTGTIASFSSRGPTADGRMKPEVCARGVATYAASASGTNTYASPNGTSLSTPLVAGVACLLVQAHPNFTPQMIRQSLMETASRAGNPDNSYGWGIVNAEAAADWGLLWSASATSGNAPLNVQFTASSTLNPSSWDWDFGDGNNSTLQSPAHTYTVPGSYTVSLTAQTSAGPLTVQRQNYISVYGDTIIVGVDSNFAGRSVVLPVNLRNSQELSSLIIPISLSQSPVAVEVDSVRRGSRTAYFESLTLLSSDPINQRYTYQLTADNGGSSPDLAVGDGNILNVYCTLDRFALGGFSSAAMVTNVSGFTPELITDETSYTPLVIQGSVATKYILRGDTDYSNDGNIDISDLTILIDHLFIDLEPLITIQAGDCNADFQVDIADLTYLINHLFIDGPPPPTP